MLTCELFLSVAKLRLEEEALDRRLVVRDDPRAGGRRRLAGHVLARGVAGRVVEARVEHAAGRVLLDVDAAGPTWSSPRRPRAISSKCSLEPLAEVARLAGALEQERRRALHAVVDDRRLHAARLAEQLHAAVVGGDERALGGRQRDVELALGVLAVDQQRAGDADRHLRDADEVLDVARHERGIERVRADVLERGAGLLGQERAPARRPPRGCSRCRGRAGSRALRVPTPERVQAAMAAPATTAAAELQRFLDGPHAAVRDRVREWLSQDGNAPVHDLPLEEHRAQVLAWARELAGRGETVAGLPARVRRRTTTSAATSPASRRSASATSRCS